MAETKMVPRPFERVFVDTHSFTSCEPHLSAHIGTIESQRVNGRRAGAVLEEDMASVHLSISKHSQLSSLSTGGEVIPFFFSPPHHHPLLISARPHTTPLRLFLPDLIYPLATSFYILPTLAFFFFFLNNFF